MTEAAALTPQMLWVMGFIALTIFLFVSELFRVDVAALVVLVLLGLTALLAPIAGPSVGLERALVDPDDLFAGFSSNAVISIIAVMIIGAGLDQSGVVARVANFMLRVGGRTERSVTATVAGTVGVISGFMQNVGAAALFIPVMTRISRRTGLPLSRLLMPMGFTAIMGGTLTMVGSSPLILLNDLIESSNRNLPAGADEVRKFELFNVTPVGIALILTVLVYFTTVGRHLLPRIKVDGGSTEPQRFLEETYGIDGEVMEAFVPQDAACVGWTVEELEREHPGVHIVGIREGDDLRIAPGAHVEIRANTELAVTGTWLAIQKFAGLNHLRLRDELMAFAEPLNPSLAGVAELVVRPGGNMVGHTVRELQFRRRYGICILAINRSDQVIRDNIREQTLKAGDVLVVHSSWDRLAMVDRERNLISMSEYPRQEPDRPHKARLAVLFFAAALGLIIFSDIRLSIALMVGAVGMVVSGVLNMDEAYRAVSWKTVFLLACLLPLGMAVEQSGTASWLAQAILDLFGDVSPWVLQAAIAILATFFTLVMSNVGATVLLVPLAVNVALGAGADPAIFALTVAVATSNSFLIPTHQVNALIMGPGDYRVRDFMRVGSVLTILFLLVSIPVLNIVI